MTLKHCSDEYGNFDTLTKAQEACDDDNNCQGVYDYECDPARPFHLCPKGSATKLAESNSCVWEKNNGEGSVMLFTIDVDRIFHAVFHITNQP